ncbi:transporter substrate-binding domain-containing protein [Rhizobium ruizarguesonis]|uniref:transporter substrate-binding domain-containing protein n=1 Tax=Rhizobium ruizarguesonis TaxID=2081791 RepID=UPI00102F9DFB|nr:transporter substrate-binding domain-containing protein [Rhizobium ruizarguesonis]TAV19691.1 transporter substrate-binding domain-containing protein [Rhizobium ruizarguesonis]TAV20425.1 transporter substrate-binding domain-containing protein [Rhizobium ruizarguesonis]
MTCVTTSEAGNALAPTGTLRATITFGNPILASRNAETGEVRGVSVDLARMLADHLRVPLKLHVLESAGKAVAAVEAGEADIGFFARDPDRAALIAFTAPYVLIEGWYLVREKSNFLKLEDVDTNGTRVTVGKGSAYDLFLTRQIQHATIERAPTSPAVVETFLETYADVAAGVRQQLGKDAAALGGLRLLPERFMVIEQAMGVARSHDSAAEVHLSDFVERVKAAGIVSEALDRHAITGATVAAPRTA